MKLWLKLSHYLSYFNTIVLLTILYFLVFPVFAILYQISHKKNKSQNTTWQKPNYTINLNEQF